MPSLWESLRDQIFLGSDAFIEPVRQALPHGRDLREVSRRPRTKSLGKYVALFDRREGMVAAYRSAGYTTQQIADACGVHYTPVDRAVRAAERATAADT